MGHLVRAGVLLLVILLIVFVGPRVMPTPTLLTAYGFHPQNIEENIEEWIAQPVQYISSSICVNCHQDEYSMWGKGGHRTVSCEDCHGPTSEHIKTGAPPVVSHETRELCGTCHARLISRPSDFPQVEMGTMGGQAECVTCHNPHEPRVGMPPEVPHHLEERGDCLSCHSPSEPLETLPPPTPHLLQGRDQCLSCHGPAEYRGATLPHPPHSLEGRSDCLLCHSKGGIKPLPEDHNGRTSATCLNCHRSE